MSPRLQDKSSEDQNKPANIVLNLINDFGGPLTIISGTTAILDFAGKLTTNKTYQKVIGGLKMTLPAAIVGYKMYDSVKNYYENKNTKNVNVRKNHRILKLMKFSPFEYDDVEHTLSYENIKIGPDITHWILKTPKTTRFEIEGYYDDNFNALERIGFENGTYYVVIKKDKDSLVLEFEIIGMLNNKLIVINTNLWYARNGYDSCNYLKKAIVLDFVDNFNTVENTMMYSANGISVRSKIDVDYEINQFDVYKLAKEIKSVIDKKKKRGYIFAGVPGTGKSSILLKLESLLKEYPILYISKSSIKYSGDLNEAFALINTLSPCIAIFEDLDCFGFGNKSNEYFSEFLLSVDSVYENHNTVIIATLNDTGEIHQSIINRPGRFDQVFLINPPKSIDEVYTVMENKYSKTTKEKLIPKENINKTLLERIVKNNFTQADICEIIEKILINDKPINNETLEHSIIELENSKKAIKICNFSNKTIIDDNEADALVSSTSHEWDIP